MLLELDCWPPVPINNVRRSIHLEPVFGAIVALAVVIDRHTDGQRPYVEDGDAEDEANSHLIFADSGSKKGFWLLGCGPIESGGFVCQCLRALADLPHVGEGTVNSAIWGNVGKASMDQPGYLRSRSFGDLLDGPVWFPAVSRLQLYTKVMATSYFNKA